MQQQFFTLSPMAGQESFNTIEVRPSQQGLAHTPTTSAMLAALQHDPFPSSSMDAAPSAFSSDTYGALSYLDATNSHDDSVTAAHSSGLSFSSYVSGSTTSFDVGGFTPHDLGMTTHTPASSESDHDPAVVKTEGTV
jgi:regulatory factor X, other